jgi:hypothetical protein
MALLVQKDGLASAAVASRFCQLTIRAIQPNNPLRYRAGLNRFAEISSATSVPRKIAL